MGEETGFTGTAFRSQVTDRGMDDGPCAGYRRTIRPCFSLRPSATWQAGVV